MRGASGSGGRICSMYRRWADNDPPALQGATNRIVQRGAVELHTDPERENRLIIRARQLAAPETRNQSLE
jgi:hypothetical protein